MPRPANPPFTFESSELLDPMTGRIKFHNVVLLRSIFPYKKGTKFHTIEFDIVNARIVLTNKNGTVHYPFIFHINVTR